MAASQGELPCLRRAVDAASRRRFLEVAGPRAALLGSEDGVFEAWIWPLKVAHGIEPLFRVEGSARALRGRAAARSVAFRPDRTALAYEGPGFRAELELFVPLAERAVVFLWRVECDRPLAIELAFEPDFQPMWPAGLGGRIARRDEESGAFLLTEELGRFAVLAGSPEETRPARAEGDHGLPQGPVSFPFAISPERARAGPVPFFLVGAETEPPGLSAAARLGEEQASIGGARSRPVVELARELYRRAGADWPRWRAELSARWQEFLDRTAHLASSEARHDEAFLWAKIAIEKAWVEVDGLGRGLVAGLAPSGSGERPGFGWFFDADALVASRAMTGYGDFAGARDVLRFAASHQRADGRLMHELVLSARLCNWAQDYPYAYYKAVTTPAFLACLGHFVAGSGELQTARELLPAATRARAHAAASQNGDGLLSNRLAGIAAVEAGPLVGRIESEVFLQGIWLSALRGLEALARATERRDLAQEARASFQRSSDAFERFWSERKGRYGFALLRDGSLCDDLTAYQAHPLGRGLGARERAYATAEELNHPALASDWGVRLFAEGSTGYDPESYNTGSVFPYLSGHAVLALFRHGLTTAGCQLLRALIELHGFAGLGFVPEHLFGDRAEHPRRGVPHQVFSSAALLQATLYGLLGLEPSATDRALALRLAPPGAGGFLRLTRLRVGETLLDLETRRESAPGGTRWTIELRRRAGPALEARLRGLLPALSQGVRLRVGDGAERDLPCARSGGSLETEEIRAELESALQLEIRARLGPELEPRAETLAEGARSRAVRPTKVGFDSREVAWTLWGPAGTTSRVPWRSDLACDFQGCSEVLERELLVAFPAGAGFTPQVVRARVR